jgi:fumarylpyruvate hydrolase
MAPWTHDLDPLPRAPLAGGGEADVRRILCIGRNYAAHAREMGASDREPPFFFAKSLDALLPAPGPVTLAYPPRTADLHHELELAVLLQAGGSDVAVAAARGLVGAYGLALDMTRRDVQAGLKAQGRPWTAAKDFDGSAVLGAMVPAAALGHPDRGPLTLDVNGVPRQRGDVSEMVWSVDELIAELSTWMRLRAGDLILTGTPAGVGAVEPGDVLHGRFPGLPDLIVNIGARA